MYTSTRKLDRLRASSGSNCGWSTDSLVTGLDKHATRQTKTGKLAFYVVHAARITGKHSANCWRPSNAHNTVEAARTCGGSNLGWPTDSLATSSHSDKPSLRIAIKHRYALYIFCSFQPKGLRQTKLNSSYRSRYLKALGYVLRELRFKKKKKNQVAKLEAENETQKCSMFYIFIGSFRPKSLGQTNLLLVRRREFTSSLLCLCQSSNGLVTSNPRLTFKLDLAYVLVRMSEEGTYFLDVLCVHGRIYLLGPLSSQDQPGSKNDRIC